MDLKTTVWEADFHQPVVHWCLGVVGLRFTILRFPYDSGMCFPMVDLRLIFQAYRTHDPCDLYATLICSCQYQFMYPTSFNRLYIYIYACIHVCIYILHIHVHVYMYVYHIHIYILLYIHVYIYIYIYIIYTICIFFISSHRHINDLLSCCNRSTIFSAKRSGALAVATAKLLHRQRLVGHASLVVFLVERWEKLHVFGGESLPFWGWWRSQFSQREGQWRRFPPDPLHQSHHLEVFSTGALEQIRMSGCHQLAADSTE